MAFVKNNQDTALKVYLGSLVAVAGATIYLCKKTDEVGECVHELLIKWTRCSLCGPRRTSFGGMQRARPVEHGVCADSVV